MRVTVLTGLSFALLWITLKMVVFWTGIYPNNVVPLVFANMFCILMAVAVGLYLQKRQDEEAGNALRDIKNAMTAAVPYTVIVSAFLYFYYASIDPEFNAHQIAEAHAGIERMINDPEQLETIKESNEAFEVMSKEEIFRELKQGPEGFYNPGATMTLSLLALLLLGTLNSIIVTVIYRNFLFRR